jgi:hypothetical protein
MNIFGWIVCILGSIVAACIVILALCLVLDKKDDE